MTVSENTKPGRRFVSLQPDYATRTALRDWAVKAGFDLGWSHGGWPQHSDNFDFHMTVVVTTNAVNVEPQARSVNPLRTTARSLGTLGDNTPVLLINSTETLTAIRDLFVGLGWEPTYPDFVPHVSLSYRWNGEPALADLALPDFPITFDWLLVAEFDGAPVMASDAAVAAHSVAMCRDTATLSGTRKTKDGYLITDARCARTGIQEYAGHEVGRPDMPLVRVFRPESEVFSRDAMASYAHRPATMGHPADGVNAANWKREAVGNTGGEISRDGGFVRVPLVLMDAAAIASVETGVREISMGYDCRLDWTPGTAPDGQSFDAVQRDLRMNHLALVERGRAGPACRVGDGAHPKQGANKTEEHRMKITVDGISYEMSDQTAELVSKLQGDAKKATDAATAATAAIDAANKARDAAVGERDALKSQLPTADGLDKMAAERGAVLDAAKKLCPDLVTSGLALADVRAAVVKAKLGDGAVVGRSPDYVAAAFDTLAVNPGGDPVADALRSGATAAKTGDAATKARSDYYARTADAWKGTAKH